MSPQPPITRKEIYVAAAFLVGAVIWLLLPVVPQPAEYHQFADRRTLWGIPNAADVLSNLGFVAVGLLGLYRLRQGLRPLSRIVHLSLNVLFLGLFLTGFGSAYYHWNPNDETLVVDRLPMTIVFAGVFGALVGERISSRSGAIVLILMLVVGPASVFYWQYTGDLALYAEVQFGGMAAILLLLSLTQRGHDPFPWWTLIAWYAISKVVETGDLFIWHATRELFAGHAVKHIAAAIGGLALANALRRPVRAQPVAA
jgi:Ceramidase